MTFKPYQSVMVLNTRMNDIICDCRGTYIKEATRGSKKGKHEVEINQTKLYFDLDQLMDHDEYFRIYNLDKTKLPKNATGQLYFLMGDYK